MKSAVIIFLLLLIPCLYGQSIYDEYANGAQCKDFDQLLNEARFPSNDVKVLANWTDALLHLTEQNPDYPQISSAHYFIGAYSYELKDYATALTHLSLAKKLDVSLEKSTPINKFIETARVHQQQQSLIFRNSLIMAVWVAFLMILLWLAFKQGRLNRRVYQLTVLFVILSALITFLCFMIDTSKMASGMEEFYLPPVLVKSTLYDVGAMPLVNLFYYGLFIFFVTALAILSSRCLKPNKRYLLTCLTPLVIGYSSVQIYTVKNCRLAKETGGTLTRFSFPEKPILWHRDVPDEMISMFDKEMQLTIKEKKLQQKEEK